LEENGHFGCQRSGYVRHNRGGYGRSSGTWLWFLEAFYQDALEVHSLDSFYRADFVCYGSVIVELKALKQISGVEVAQVINYLKASGFRKGLLLNFGAQSLGYKRLVLNLRESEKSADV
jgi:hypothetical protein